MSDRQLPVLISAAGGLVGLGIGLIGIDQGSRFVAIVTFTLLGACVAALCWCGFARRRWRVADAADRAKREEDERRRADAEAQLRAQVGRTQRESSVLVARLQSADDTRSRYENALGAIASRGSRTVRHHSATFVYEIGQDATGDRVIEHYSTVAGDADRPLLWCDVRISILGSTGQVDSVRDVHDVEASQVVAGRRYPLELLAAGHVGAGVRALVLFDPVIGPVPRDWTCSYRWSLWEPLRRQRSDTLAFDVLRTVRYDELEIHIVFPRTAIGPVVRPREPATNIAEPDEPADLGDGRREFVVRLSDPEPDHYSWSLRVDSFAPGE